MINSLLKKLKLQTICVLKIRLEMAVYLRILLQSYSIYLPQKTESLKIKVYATYLGEFRFGSKLKSIK